MPPAPGMSPTPTSTAPQYSSARATTWLQAAISSKPPPRVTLNGAATTGKGEYLIAWVIVWKVREISSMRAKRLLLASSRISARLAPAQKWVPSWDTTRPL